MKSSTALLPLYAVPALAFPSWLMEKDLEDHEMRRAAWIAAEIEVEAAKQRRDGLVSRAPGFDAEKQLVDVSGEHEFEAPGENDLRGPCPGLNALANHNYIPHNGVASITQFIEATTKVYGMGLDLAAFLSIYGAVFNGDLTSWSIGGEPPGGLLDLIGLLGTPQGLLGSHNNYESDVSPTRGDLYQYDDNGNLRLDQFTDLYNQPLGEKGYDLEPLTAHRAARFEQSVQNNPYFFNGPFSGVAVQPAAYTFIYRFMGNKSEEHPEGYLDADVLKTFFAVTGEEGSFEHEPGHERIPENWYRRAFGDEYSIPFFQIDLLAAALEHPEFLSIGGNTGEVDTFTGVDVTDLTGGVFNLKTLTEGNNLFCFVSQFGRQAAPDILGGLFESLTKPLRVLTDAVDDAISGLGCPQLARDDVDTSSFKDFPGAQGAY